VNNCINFEFEILTNAIPNYPNTEKMNEQVEVKRFTPNDRSFAPLGNRFVHKLSFPYRYLSDISRQNNIQRFLESGNYDILHAHHPSIPHTYAKMSRISGKPISMKKTIFKTNKPMLLTIHGLLSKLNSEPVLKSYEDYIINSYNNIICVDKIIFNHVKSLQYSKNKNIWFIPNSIDIKRFNNAPLTPTDKLKVGFIGRLEKSRGLKFLEQLMDNLPNYVELHVVGSGSIQTINEFKKQADKKQIKFHSNIPNEKLPAFLHGIDVLFNPVLAEGISRISLESMACGRPTIMLDKGDRYPIANGTTGYLIKENIQDILRTLEFIQASKNILQTMGDNARNIVEKEFSNEVIIPKIEAVYNKLLEDT
jgi:glycosyltransferase involved in cell wall biosynthesis